MGVFICTYNWKLECLISTYNMQLCPIALASTYYRVYTTEYICVQVQIKCPESSNYSDNVWASVG